MASRASIGARRGIATASIEQSIHSIAAGLKLNVPADPSPQVNRDPNLRGAAQQERIAAFLALVADRVGKPVKEPEEPQGSADGATPPPINPDEPPHTQTISPDPSIQAMRDAANAPPESEGDGGTEDEPTFGGHPLSAFDGLDDDEILKMEHVGDATLKKVKAAQRKRDQARS